MNRNTPVLVIAGLVLTAAIAGGAYFFTREPQIPDLDRQFTPLARFPQDIQDEAKRKVESAIAELRENPDLVSRWLEVAVYRKNADDFDGAEKIWLYLTSRWPEDPVAYNNLADLYQNYTKDYDRAEKYWRTLIGLQPANIPAYRNLHDLYKDKLADLKAAESILREGLERNPRTLDLLIPLAIFKRERGRQEEARALFTEAKEEALQQGKEALAELLQGELQNLPL